MNLRIALAASIAVVLAGGSAYLVSERGASKPPQHHRPNVSTPKPVRSSSPSAVASVTPSAAPSASKAAPPPPAATPATLATHILVIMEENQGYDASQSNCGAQNAYFCQLASAYTSVTNWYGVTHPSLPNYLAITSGSTQGCTSDSCGAYPGANLGEQLTAARIPWMAYMESMPSPCDASDGGEYAERHNPFTHYTDLGAACAAHDVPYPGVAGLLGQLDGSGAPDFVWITPNLIDDMHNEPPNDMPDGAVADGNAWLASNLAPVLTSPWFTNYRSTVIVTEDENDAQPSGICCGDAAGGQIPELVISRNAAGRGMVALTGDQYGTLRTIEEAFRLPLLGAAAEATNGDLSQYFG